MKYLVFVRGEENDLRNQTVSEIMELLNPDINHIRAMRVSMNDYAPFATRGERKAAASNVKKLIRKLLGGNHQEEFIVVDNSNMNHNDWHSLLKLAEEYGATVEGIGVDVRKNEQSVSEGRKNEEYPNVHVFKAMMYKYVWVENEQDVETVKETLLKLIN